MPQTKLILFKAFAWKQLLKIEITKVNPVNQRQDATPTPEMNGIDFAAGKAAWNAPNIIVPSITACGLNHVTTQAEDIVFRMDNMDFERSISSTFALSSPIPM